MGCIYRRKKKLDDRTLIETGPYWIRYYRNGRPICESAETEVYATAKTKLQEKKGDIARGLPVTPGTNKILVDELLEDLKTEYRTNGRKTIGDLEGRCENHLSPFFGRLRAANVTTANTRTLPWRDSKQGRLTPKSIGSWQRSSVLSPWRSN